MVPLATCAALFAAVAGSASAQTQTEPTRVQPRRVTHAQPAPSHQLPRARVLGPQRLRLYSAPHQRAQAAGEAHDVIVIGADADVFNAPAALLSKDGVHFSPASFSATLLESHARGVVVGARLPGLTLPPLSPDAGRPCVIDTIGRERIVGWLVAWDDARVSVRHPALGVFSFQVHELTRLWFDPESADAPSPASEGEEPTIVLANGDALEGPFVFDAESITTETTIGVISAPLARIRGVYFGHHPQGATAPRLVLADGSHIAIASVSGALGRNGDIAVTLPSGRRRAIASRSIIAWLAPGTSAAPLESRLVTAGPRIFILPPEAAQSGVIVARLRAPDSPWTDARVTLWLDREPIWAQQLDERTPEAAFTAPLTSSGLQLHIGAGPNGPAHAIARLTGLTLTWQTVRGHDRPDSMSDPAPPD